MDPPILNTLTLIIKTFNLMEWVYLVTVGYIWDRSQLFVATVLGILTVK
jgi:hypothetical protein